MGKKINFDGVRIDEEKLYAQVMNDWAESWLVRSRRQRKWESAFRQYRGLLPKKIKPWPNCSNLNVPITDSFVDTMAANLMSSFFGAPKIVEVAPVSSNDVLTAKKREQFLNWQLINEIDFLPIADRIVETALIYGDAVVKVRYVRETRKTTHTETRLVEDEQGIPREQEVEVEDEVVVKDHPVVDVPNIDDIGVAQNAVGTQKSDSRFIIHRTRVANSDYLDLVDNEGYRPLDLPASNDTATETMHSTLKGMGIDYSKKQYLGLSQDIGDDRNTVTLMEWYGSFFNEDNDKYQELVVIVHPSSGTVVKAFVNPYPFRPFVKFSPMPINNQFYSVGVPEKLKFIQAEVNTIHNQRIDSATKRIMQPFFYRAGSSFDPDIMFLEPGGGYPVDDPQDVNFPAFQDAPASQFNEEATLWRYAERLMGIDENTQGVMSRGEKTATEVATSTQRGGIRFNTIFQRMENAFRKLMHMIGVFNQENMPAEKEYRVVGSDGRFRWQPITAQEMGGKLDLFMHGLSVMEERSRVARAQSVYTAAIGNPLVLSDQTALYEVSKYFFETVGGPSINIDRVLPVPPQAATRSPQEEHDMMYEGKYPAPDVREDAQRHLVTHDGEMNQQGFRETIRPEIQQLFIAHIEQTKALAAAQTQMKALGQMQMIGSGSVQPGATAPQPAPGQGGILNAGGQTQKASQERQIT